MVRIIVVILFGLGFLAPETKAQCSLDYSSTNYFCDLDSLLLHANPTSGVPPFTFLWETGETTQTIMIPLALGDYMVTMTDATGCVAIINCHIKPFPQVLYYPFNQNACEGDTVTLFLEWFRDSIPGALYEWSTGETTPTIQITDDITWSATVTDPSTGCEYVIPPNFFEFHFTPQPTIVGPNFLCNGESIVLSVDGGPFGTIIWYPEFLYEPTLTVTTPGEYIVWTSSPTAGYCWKQDTIVITEGDIPPPQLTGPPTLCEGQSGNITVTNSVEYIGFAWSSGESTPVIEVNEPGTFTVTVTHEDGCTASASITVGTNNGPTGALTPSTATCGLSNGSIDLTMDPPGSYTYAWSNGSSTQDINNVPPGDYIVTITDPNGCTSILESAVPDQQPVITIDEIITPNSSCSGFNGAIDISVIPVGSYEYNWSTGATSQDITGLGPGAYTVTVSTGLTCIATDDFEIEDISNAADINPVVTAASCGLANGAIDLQMFGGTEPFVFTWSNGEVIEDLTDLSAGTYQVTVTGADGCVSVTAISVPNEDVAISIQGTVVPNSSCNQSNGSIDIVVSPAIDYMYQWSNGSTSEDLFDIGASTYTVTVTSGNSCVQTASFTVSNENIPFSISGTTSPDLSCSASTGSIDVVISPAGSYTYLWSNGSTEEDLQNLAAGIYEVTVTNTDNCSITSSFTITASSPAIVISGVAINNTSCQVPNGSLDINTTPAGTYTYTWSTGAISEDLAGIGAGMYAVTVTDVNGCSADTSFAIVDNSTTFSLSAVSAPNTSCTAANGSIDLSINPAGSYSFQWSTGAITEDLQNLGGGNYIVTVTDPNQCQGIDTFTVINNTPSLAVTSSISGDTCNSNNGSISLDVIPAGNTYLWSNGSTNEDQSALGAGMYSVTITNSSGCIETDTFTVNSINTSFVLSGTTTDNSSCGVPSGAIDVSIAPAGSYNYVWTNGSITEDLHQLSAGTYMITVSDLSGCSSGMSFTILDQSEPILVNSVTAPATCGSANGEIQLNITPANGNTFAWLSGQTAEDIAGLLPGNYTVTIINASGCDTTMTFVVPDSGSVFSSNAIISNVQDCITPDGTIDLTVLPVGVYSFAWSNGSNTEDLAGLHAGEYSVTITDAFGCIEPDTFSILDETKIPELSATVTPATCGQASGAIDLQVTSVDDYTLLWENGNVAEDLVAISPGFYSVTVTTVNGCSATAVWEVVNINSNFQVNAFTGNQTSCIQANGFIDLTILPADIYFFSWSTGASTEDLNDLPAGTYTVTITDQASCATSTTFDIQAILPTPVVTGVVQPTVCGHPNGSIALAIEPPGHYQINWNTGDTLSSLTDLAPGTYSVFVIDDMGCEADGEFEIPEGEGLEAIMDAAIDATGNHIVHCSLSLNVPVTMISSIVWSPGDMMSCQDTVCIEQDILVESRTLVTAMVTDMNGCTVEASLVLDIDKEYHVYIPNVFTPNGDGPSERFTVYGNDEVEIVSLLEIFDRWGNNVFINTEFPPNEDSYGWDGVFKGQMMNPAVYAYHAIVRFTNGEEAHFVGDVTLVR